MGNQGKAPKLLTNRQYRLQKYPGKGGWTYAEIPEVNYNRKNPFGWVQVNGSIDHVELKHYKLMPMGDSKLFLPVKAEIRKKIGKQEGDWVHVILYADDEPLHIPEEFLLCLKDEPDAEKFFNTLSESKKSEYLKWIYAAKTDDLKVNRMADAISKLAARKTLID